MGAGPTAGPGWEHYEGIAVQLADSGRMGVVRRISATGAATVALGSEDAQKRLQVPEAAEVIQTVSQRRQRAVEVHGPPAFAYVSILQFPKDEKNGTEAIEEAVKLVRSSESFITLSDYKQLLLAACLPWALLRAVHFERWSV